MSFVPSKSPVKHNILTDHFGLDFMVAAHKAFYSTMLSGLVNDPWKIWIVKMKIFKFVFDHVPKITSNFVMLFLFLIYFILNANDMICRKSQLLNILTTLMHSNLSKIIWHWCNLHSISENILIILHKLEELFCKSICNTSKFKTR